MKDLFGEERDAAEKGRAELSLMLHGRSEKALLLSDDGKRRQWVPLSLVKGLNEDARPLEAARQGDVIEISLPEWAARERGWI